VAFDERMRRWPVSKMARSSAPSYNNLTIWLPGHSVDGEVVGGDKSGIPAGKQLFVPTLVIKKDSVEEFTEKDQWLAWAHQIVVEMVDDLAPDDAMTVPILQMKKVEKRFPACTR